MCIEIIISLDWMIASRRFLSRLFTLILIRLVITDCSVSCLLNFYHCALHYGGSRNLKNRLSLMIRDDEGLSEDKIPINKSRRQKETRNDIMYTRESMRFKWVFITVDNRTWKHITVEDKHFVRLFNQKVRYQEPTCGLQIISNFRERMDHKSSVTGKNMVQRKKVVFNLDQHDE